MYLNPSHIEFPPNRAIIHTNEAAQGKPTAMKSAKNHKPKNGMPEKVTKQPGKGGGAMQTGLMAAKGEGSAADKRSDAKMAMNGVRSTTKNAKYC